MLFLYLQRDINPCCGFESCIDPDMPERSKWFYPDLLRKINGYEEENEKLKTKCEVLEKDVEGLRKVLLRKSKIWNCL